MTSDERLAVLETKLNSVEHMVDHIAKKVDEIQRFNSKLTVGGTTLFLVASSIGGIIFWIMDNVVFSWK